ncbi:helix-turn-helix transcriptional regulator [Plantactinospora sp. KLBMP9567]|uniref:helix-turn-helix domain-containing protein n=1 Tax=Plantactinospora sp. KLBMP9567 TaxID=3085900 RepID=UPI002981B126|nr:helix-turn-helix transcriptional regulator [Plantactinospora sp. KLBMP9567]MDW5329865.1 helix-turn-helix transcriptional regulator [Plantactinospora sp. KLBMP9567]
MIEVPEPLAAFIVVEIRRGRQAAKMTQEAFGRAANFSATHVSAVENRTRALTMDFIVGADRALKTGGVYERLVITLGVPTWLREWIDHEREAVALRSFENAVLPGLFQTEAYARAVLGAGLLTAEQLQQKVTERLDRQSILTRDDPPQVIAIVDESVIRRVIGGREAMREQLARLLKLGTTPLVQIQVVPDNVGAYLGLSGPFVLATLASNVDVGYIDSQLHGKVLEQPADVLQLRRAWDAIRGGALAVPQSTELITRVMEQL